jgi:hypothetical protein
MRWCTTGFFTVRLFCFSFSIPKKPQKKTDLCGSFRKKSPFFSDVFCNFTFRRETGKKDGKIAVFSVIILQFLVIYLHAHISLLQMHGQIQQGGARSV